MAAVRKFGDYIEPVAYVENVKLYAAVKRLDAPLTRCYTSASGQTVSPTAVAG